MTAPAAAQAAERRATVGVSFDPRSVAYGAVSFRLNTHILTCGPCRSGDDFGLCPVADGLLDALLRAYVSQEDDL